MKLTLEEYKALNGNVCPFCESDNIKCYNVEHDQEVIYRDHECWTCGRGWTEYFTVTEIAPWDVEMWKNQNGKGDPS